MTGIAAGNPETGGQVLRGTHHRQSENKHARPEDPDAEATKGGRLYCEALATAAGAGSVGIDKLKTFTIQAVGKIQHRTHQVKKAFLVHEDFDPLVFKNLIGCLDLIIKIQVVHQPRASASFHEYTHIVMNSVSFFFAQRDNLFFGFISYSDHSSRLQEIGLSTTLKTVIVFMSRP